MDITFDLFANINKTPVSVEANFIFLPVDSNARSGRDFQQGYRGRNLCQTEARKAMASRLGIVLQRSQQEIPDVMFQK
jgi:hypothetical protein